MARVVTQRTAPPYLLIVMVFLFLIAATLAVLGWMESDKAKKRAIIAERSRQKLGDSADLRYAKVLLMMDKNRLGIYRFSDGWAEAPIEEDEGFGDTVELPPAWKGNDEISCLVSENSHFLPRPEPESEVEQVEVEEEQPEGKEEIEGEEKTGRKEIVIFGGDGKFRRVLSESWPDEAIP